MGYPGEVALPQPLHGVVFFTPLHRKPLIRSRINRTISKGYWKTTGKDRRVRHGLRVVGMKKTLVFHLGRVLGGERTDWVMHEYRLEDEELARSEILQDGLQEILLPQVKFTMLYCNYLLVCNYLLKLTEYQLASSLQTTVSSILNHLVNKPLIFL